MELLRLCWIAGTLLVGCGGSSDRDRTDTDAFAADWAPRSRKNIRDISGTWVAVVPTALERKEAVIRAGLKGGPALGLEPPLRPEERGWFDGATDPDQPYQAWLRCLDRCRFEIRESSIWNHGYLGWDKVGSSLSRPEFRGRDVTFHLTPHETKGDKGTVRIRFNPDWSRFRVLAFELDHAIRDPHLGQKLELLFQRKDDPWQDAQAGSRQE